MKKIAIIGSGGLGREILGIIKGINKFQKTWDFIGFYDDNITEELINGYSVLGKIDSLNTIEEELHIVVAIGSPKIKKIIIDKILNPKIIFPNLIHPSVIQYDEETISLGKGIIVAANCVLTVNIKVEDFVYINTASIISHDVTLGAYTMIMPTVSISAGATIGTSVYIGNGTKIDQPVRIEDHTVVKAGTILSN